MLVGKLAAQGLHSELLDGDQIRLATQNILGFSEDARHAHAVYVAFCAALLNRNGVFAAVALVSPFVRTREAAKRVVGANFVEIFLDCPKRICVARDPKGLYKKAASGSLTGFTGHDGAYERPPAADLTINTSTEDPASSLDRILQLLFEKGLL